LIINYFNYVFISLYLRTGCSYMACPSYCTYCGMSWVWAPTGDAAQLSSLLHEINRDKICQSTLFTCWCLEVYDIVRWAPASF